MRRICQTFSMLFSVKVEGRKAALNYEKGPKASLRINVLKILSKKIKKRKRKATTDGTGSQIINFTLHFVLYNLTIIRG